MKQLICKECGSERDIGRRLCRSCNLKRLIESANSRPRYTWFKTCEACNKDFKAWRKKTTICTDCYKSMVSLKKNKSVTNGYVFLKQPGKTEHREIAVSLLGRRLKTNEVVHHLDENPKNNLVSNLIVMTRSMHGKLHLYLDKQRVILEKSGIENFENCWENLRVPTTTAWLETTNAKVIKLWEIGQSAAEPLTENSYGEGSETMHEAPYH
jgi:hypothetical protein